MVFTSFSTYSFGCFAPASRLSMSRRPEAQGPEWVWMQLMRIWLPGMPLSASARARTSRTWSLEKKSRSRVMKATSFPPSSK